MGPILNQAAFIEPAVKLTRADYDLLTRLDATPRFVSGDFTALVSRGYVSEYRPEWANTFLYFLTPRGVTLKLWWANE